MNVLGKLFFLFSPFAVITIHGKSMHPIHPDGSKVLIHKVFYLFQKPQIGDIVLVRDPRDNKMLIKRVQDKKNDAFFVVGDNKKESTDSRHFGFVARRAIIGKVIARL